MKYSRSGWRRRQQPLRWRVKPLTSPRLFSTRKRYPEAGLTLPEILVVIVIVGILSSILAPGWLGLQTANALNVGQDGVYQALRQAQQQAIQNRQHWQVGFREANQQVEWTTYASASRPPSNWQPLAAGVRIAPQETTLRQQNRSIYFVEFNSKGNVTPPFGRLSLMGSRSGKQRRCVFVSTLLGVLRRASDQACYS